MNARGLLDEGLSLSLCLCARVCVCCPLQAKLFLHALFLVSTAFWGLVCSPHAAARCSMLWFVSWLWNVFGFIPIGLLHFHWAPDWMFAARVWTWNLYYWLATANMHQYVYVCFIHLYLYTFVCYWFTFPNCFCLPSVSSGRLSWKLSVTNVAGISFIWASYGLWNDCKQCTQSPRHRNTHTHALTQHVV